MASSGRFGARGGSSAAAQESEVPKCHLHKKPNKACKFCKAYTTWLESKQKEAEDKKQAQANYLKGQLSGNTRTIDETLATPGLGMEIFPSSLKRHIEVHSLTKDLDDMSVKMVLGVIEGCSSCELESEGNLATGTLSIKVKEPSQFICCIFNLMSRKMARQDLDSMLNSRSCYLRCAGFLLIRLMMHPEQYWELLSPHLLDPEPILPFPEESLESCPVGKYVEDLLVKDSYLDLVLPRMQLGVRKTIERRILFYEQFRRRYALNREDMEPFNRSGTPVEVCLVDGQWAKGMTAGEPPSYSYPITVPVQLLTGEYIDASIGMIIRPDTNAPEDDLTRCRGTNNQELVDRYNKKTRESALAVGNEYCKPISGAIYIASQRVVAITGKKNKDRGAEHDSEDEELQEERLREAKKQRGLAMKRDEQLAAIETKYCGVPTLAQSANPVQNAVDAPDRLRLG